MAGQQASWRTHLPLMQQQMERNADKDRCEHISFKVVSLEEEMYQNLISKTLFGRKYEPTCWLKTQSEVLTFIIVYTISPDAG